MNLNKTPWITFQNEKVPLYNFNLSRYPVAVRSLAQADCENGQMLAEQYQAAKDPKQQQKLFEAIQFIHDFLGQSYFGQRNAAKRVGLSDKETREYDRDRKSLNLDANAFATSIDRNEPEDSEDETEGPKTVNASAAIADAMTSFTAGQKRARQLGAAKARQKKALKPKSN